MMLSVLLRASLEGAVLVFLVWIVTRGCAWLSPGVRTILWWSAAAKFLIAVVWVSPVAVPILPDTTRATAVVTSGSTAPKALVIPAFDFTDKGPNAESSGNNRWEQPALALWVVGLVSAAAFGARRWHHVRTVIAR